MSLFSYIENKLEFKPRDHGAALQPGDVVKLEDGTLRLIGHVNPQRGLCNCCDDFFDSDIVGIASIFDLYFCQDALEWKDGACSHSHT